jgi:uridine phosphorylase
LILNSDGSIYHLNLLPSDIAPTVFLVGDPDRVETVSSFFDTVEIRKQKREFITHCGTLRGKRLTVISTGIGTDNIDIVMNELDALVNIDLRSGLPKSQMRSLNIIRIGTSGSLQHDIDTDEMVVSTHGLGLDQLMHHYQIEYTAEEKELAHLVSMIIQAEYIRPYIVSSSQRLLSLFTEFKRGMTATCSGFYAPQGRKLRAEGNFPGLIDQLHYFHDDGRRVTNFEMETAAIYGLARVLGHEALSVNAIMANRMTRTFSRTPHETIERTIEAVLGIIAPKQ